MHLRHFSNKTVCVKSHITDKTLKLVFLYELMCTLLQMINAVKIYIENYVKKATHDTLFT